MQEKFARRMQLVKPSAIRELFKLAADPEVISFGGGFPDPEVFPIDKMRKVFDAVLADEGKVALQYSNSEGLVLLRQKLAERMKRAGVSATPDHIQMIQGGQQGLDLVAKMFVDKGDTIIVENPTFIGALIAFNPYEPNYATVELDGEGMDMDSLETALKSNRNVSFIYTVPEFHNPTGKTLSLARRKRLVELANQYDVLILEDSPYREIRYEGEVLPPIKSFDTQGRVIHIGSFAKILAPGFRLGWVVAEPEFTGKLCQLKMAADTQNSTLNMYAVNKFMELYDLDAHIERIRELYRQKRDLIFKVMDETFPENVSYTHSEGGLFTWLTLPEGVDAAKLMVERTLPEAKVAYVPGAQFYALEPELNHCRLNFSCMSEEKIITGIAKLGAILKTL